MVKRMVTFLLSMSLVLLILFFLFFSDEKSNVSSNLIMQEVHEKLDKVKQRVIDSAVATYIADNGVNPKKLEDLVSSGLLNPEDILDHNGKTLSFNPYEGVDSTPAEKRFGKSCGRCGKNVPSTSKVGDSCPHCGVRWGHERKSYSF